MGQQASAVIAHGRRYDNARILAEQLTEAMGSRAVIEQAKGVHIAQHGVDADGAFALLKRESQNRNRKLRDVAVDVVERARLAAAARAPAGGR
jgi:AmiR/NasT family two-component response regulator